MKDVCQRTLMLTDTRLRVNTAEVVRSRRRGLTKGSGREGVSAQAGSAPGDAGIHRLVFHEILEVLADYLCLISQELRLGGVT